MPYLIVKGTYHIVGKQPDGDTVGFRPADQEVWLKLTSMRVPRMNRSGDVSIRFEAIDALETHYRGQSWLPEYSQPLELANAARDHMLAGIGIDPQLVEWGNKEVKSAPDGVPGYIATNGIDPYGRVIAFVFAGESPTFDGDDNFFLSENLVEQSVNHSLARKGLVYPTFYSALYPTLRNVIAAACVQARQDELGIWPLDVSRRGISIPSREDLTPLTEHHCVFPKLFRRLITHLSQNGEVRNFKGFLYTQPDATIRIDNCEMATFSRYVKVTKNQAKVSLTTQAENLLFAPQ